MNPFLKLVKKWSDIHLNKFEISVFDGLNSFSINTYTTSQEIRKTEEEFLFFKNQFHSGVLDLTFGSFGPEYDNGAFQARFHFQNLGKLNISIRMKSEYLNFGSKSVAKEANLFLRSEAFFLDNFIQSLKT